MWKLLNLFRRPTPAQLHQRRLLRLYRQRRQRDRLQLWLLSFLLAKARHSSADIAAARSARTACPPGHLPPKRQTGAKTANAKPAPPPPKPSRRRFRLPCQAWRVRLRRRLLLSFLTWLAKCLVKALRSRGSPIRSARSSSN